MSELNKEISTIDEVDAELLEKIADMLGKPVGAFNSDLLGRVGPHRRIHVIDAAVLPTVPATTFTLSVMANAHRVASDLLREAS